VHLAFSMSPFGAHSSVWAQAHGLKGWNKLDEVQATGEGMPLASKGYKNRVVGGVISWLFCRRVFLSWFWQVSFWFLCESLGFFPWGYS